MNDLNEDKLYQKIIEPLKKQNITAPDDLWLKVRGRIENQSAHPLMRFRLQFAMFSLLLVAGFGVYETYQLSPQMQANRYLKEDVLNVQSIYTEYEYFSAGTF